MNNQNVDHTGMLSNPVVQELVAGDLTQANGGAVVDTPPSLACGQGQAPPVAEGLPGDFHKLALVGVTDIHVTDGTSDSIPDTVARYIGENGTTLIIASGKKYKVKFRATDTPLYLEWLYENADQPLRAVRYRDTEIIPNAIARVTLKDGKISSLRYDSNNDGVVDKRVRPTAALEGTAAPDQRAQNKGHERIARRDPACNGSSHRQRLSGVARTVYSIDGQHFQLYTDPIDVDAAVTSLYVFADDEAELLKAVKFDLD